MSNDSKDQRPRDMSRISLEEEWEVRYWSKDLGCTPEELRKTVESAGTTAVEKVRDALKK
jgi:hypothetical protein